MNKNIRFFLAFAAVTAAGAFAFAGTLASRKISYDSVPISNTYVALIFEDGPSSMLTPQVLKILAAHHAKATFFVTGESALSHPEILKQEIAGGHEVGSRSWTHSMFSNQEDAQFMGDLLRTDQAIKTATGYSPRLFSPFDTTFTDVQCDTVNKQFGYTMIYWSIDALAAKSKGAAAVTDSIVSQAKPGAIIMSSDIDSTSVAALPNVLDTLAGKGYKFVTVSDLISLTTYAGQKRVLAAEGGPSVPPKPVAPRPVSPSTYTTPPATHTPTPSTPTPANYHPFGVESPSEPAVPDSGAQ